MSRKEKEEKAKVEAEEISKAEAEENVSDEKEETELSQQDKLMLEIKQLKSDLEKAKNDYYKAYADADNLKKRLQNEANIASKYRIQSFALNILPALDALELALNGKDENDGFVKGVKLTYDSIMHALENEGVSQVDCLNKPFDANVAHAIMTEKVEGVEPDIVVEVMQKGYMLKDRLLRAALVKVSE